MIQNAVDKLMIGPMWPNVTARHRAALKPEPRLKALSGDQHGPTSLSAAALFVCFPKSFMCSQGKSDARESLRNPARL